MGWVFVFSQRGVIITGSFSTRSRIISNELLPEPTMIPALSVVTGIPLVRRITSTCAREARCFESFS